MKNLLALSLVVSTLAACAPAAQDYTKKLKDIQEQTKIDIEDIKINSPDMGDINAKVKEALEAALEVEGARAGRITVEGVLVARQGNKFLLDPRIQVIQEGGKRSDGSEAKADADTKVEMTDLASGDTKALVAEKYINLGCSDLNAADTENLEALEVSLQSKESPLIISAKKIFICGAQQTASNNVTISASEITLKDADISLASAGTIAEHQGSLNIATNTIVIQGTNKIMTVGQNMQAPVPNGAGLQVTVREELRGSGHLVLKTMGGNVTKVIEKD